MKIIVKKFGGTSVGDITRIKRVASYLSSFKRKNRDVGMVVVVSAMAGETNRLVALAKSCVASPDPRALDALLCTGEQVNVSLMTMALQEEGYAAEGFLSWQIPIRTNERYGNAEIEEIGDERLLRILSEGKIAVVAGFQGVDGDGSLTTLGRGGSDITAVAVAAAIKADACYIYTDVDGVYSTDPRLCREAKRLSYITHEEMLELASLGAKVLHPRSVFFAMRYKVPLFVCSTFAGEEAQGTWIVEEGDPMERPIISGIAHRIDEARVSVTGLKGGIESLSEVFTRLASEGIAPDMVQQFQSEREGSVVSFNVQDDQSTQALEIVREKLPLLGASGASLDRNIARVSVVGSGLRYHPHIVAEVLKALSEEHVEVMMMGTSDIKISLIIPRKYCEMAVRTLHELFVEE